MAMTDPDDLKERRKGAAAFGAFMLSLSVANVLSGHLVGTGVRIRHDTTRADEPVLFWSVTAFYVLMSAWLLYFFWKTRRGPPAD